MHEMTVAQSLFEIVNEEMRRADLNRLTAIRLRIGAMSAVIPDSLEFCFEVIAKGTPMEGARLECTVVPVSGRCETCGEEFRVRDLSFRCPSCRSGEINLSGGEELCLEEVEGE